MGNENPDLESVLRQALQGVAANKGPCPSIERILQYQSHELPPDAEDETKTHFIACGSCEALFLRLENFGETTTEPSVSRHWPLSFFLQPWFPYMVAALLLVALLTGIGRRRTVAEVSRPAVVAEALQAFELPQARGKVDRVVQPGRSERFVLKFFIPIEPGQSLFASMRNGAGDEVFKPIQIGNIDTMGNVELVCQTKAFPVGTYTLTVSEAGSARHFQYSFFVR